MANSGDNVNAPGYLFITSGAGWALLSKGLLERSIPILVNKRLLLLVILGLGLGLRIFGIDFGLPLQLNPDEWSQVETARHMLSGDLNPHFFRYSSLVIYQSFVIDSGVELLAQFGHLSTSTATYFLLGRILSAVYGTLSVWAIFLLGRSVLNEWVGLGAALLLAISPEYIRQSHYATVDVAMTFWIILTFVLFLQAIKGRGAAYAAVGVSAGLAIGTKYSAALVLLPLLVLSIWHLWRTGKMGWSWLDTTRTAVLWIGVGSAVLAGLYLLPVSSLLALGQSWTTENMIKPEYLGLFNNLLRVTAIAAIAAICLGIGALRIDWLRRFANVLLHPQILLFLAAVGGTFILTSPYVFLDLRHSAQDIFYEYRHMLLGPAALFKSDDPILATFQPNPIFPDPAYYWNWWLGQNGWLILALGLFGAAVLARKSLLAFGATASFVIILIFTLTHAGNKADRYALPLLPIFSLWASVGLWAVFKFRTMDKHSALKVVLLAAVCLVPTFSSLNAIYNEFVLPDTRVLAFNWLQQNVSPGAIIVREFDAPDLEVTDAPYQTIATSGAFETKSLEDWQSAGVDFILVGSMREWYRARADLYPQINGNYVALEQRARLAKEIDASAASHGSTIRIYQLP